MVPRRASIVGTRAEETFSRAVTAIVVPSTMGLSSIDTSVLRSKGIYMLASNSVVIQLSQVYTTMYDRARPIAAPTSVSSKFSHSTCARISPLVAP